jgi:excinuclease ABC subunit B
MAGEFRLHPPWPPAGDQPQAIEALVKGVESGHGWQVLLGVTGSGKTFTMANVIARVQKPTLVIAHNKTLAAQLCAEFKEFFRENAVEYFVSYYDYYQPEAYIPQTDTYIEKDSSINDELDRLRHSATQSLLERRDVIIVASVSCIYGLGSPEDYEAITLAIERGKSYNRDEVLRRLVDMQFQRNDVNLTRGKFRVRGDVLEIHSVDEELITRVEMFGDEIERITILSPITGEVIQEKDRTVVFAASHYVAPWDKLERALESIEAELEERLAWFKSQGKPLEAERLEQRTRYDMEMIREVGYCAGIENYSRHLDGRPPGSHPSVLLHYFPREFLCILDESHQSVPQLKGMFHADRSRKVPLVEYGFRLPSCFDNRPLYWEEFDALLSHVICTSATPADYERQRAKQIVEQVVRPTGLVDPKVEVRPTKGQIDDLIAEIQKRVAQGERVLVTTLTKKMAEDLTEYLADVNIKVHYLHSEIETLVRSEILRDLRLGTYDVVVGINLLREGLDLPEVSLVAILDADKEGFLRSETSLIQTMGRAARHVRGEVIMFADNVTDSMRRALDETERRRAKQIAFNEAHGITPRTVEKEVRALLSAEQVAEEPAAYFFDTGDIEKEKPRIIAELEHEMRAAAAELRFEDAARLRDEIALLCGKPPEPQTAWVKGKRHRLRKGK